MAKIHNSFNQSSQQFKKLHNWEKITTVKQLWQTYPQKIRTLINALNLEYKGLGVVQNDLQKGDTVTACRSLLKYYRYNRNSEGWLRNKKIAQRSSKYIHTAQLLLRNRVDLANAVSKVEVTKDGGWNWNYTGPNNDKEFGYSLNKQHYLLTLLDAWKKTHQSKYADFLDLRMRDWILHNPLPAKGDSVYMVLNSHGKLDWRDISNVRWRDLGVGDRLFCWPKLFYGFQSADDFNPATRLLMLFSIQEQAQYLKKYHKKAHNWTTVEMDGLALTGLAFPEFKDAHVWADYALKVMEKEINRQVYPDGVQTELSTMTHIKSLSHFQSVANHFRMAGHSVPKSYRHRLEQMYNYLAYSMRPNGYQPLNNDSDRKNIRSLVLKAAQIYHRQDWVWIATNGEKGEKPKGLPSKMFPWAGIQIMRSGWGKNAQWSFFDVGPWGTGHQHCDMLHLSISAYGKNLLVDGGRYTHKNYFSLDPTTWRGYFRSSFSHNVIIVDGKGQNPGPTKALKPLKKGVDYVSNKLFDYARGTFKSGFNGVKGRIQHTRAILYMRNKYWIVVDRIVTDRHRNLNVLWHYAPICKVMIKDKSVVTNNAGEGNLKIIPIANLDWKVKIIKGQIHPVIQGWHSSEYGEKRPSPVAIYSTHINRSRSFIWLIIPGKEKIPLIRINKLKTKLNKSVLCVQENENQPISITVPLIKSMEPTTSQGCKD